MVQPPYRIFWGERLQSINAKYALEFIVVVREMFIHICAIDVEARWLLTSKDVKIVAVRDNVVKAKATTPLHCSAIENGWIGVNV